jgi:restriction system protein
MPLPSRLLFHLNDQIARLQGTRAVALDRDTVTTLTWKEVQNLVSEAFRRRGFGVQAFSGGQGPVDLVLSKDGEKTFVNCKQWRVWEVDYRPLAELYGYMSGAGAERAVMLTTGRFSQKAREFAKRHNLYLIDGSGLVELIQGAV